tara:strand:- start:60 stop:350 length:291 start_codon:yes stop_codon:yes gene_type:complete
MNSLFIVDPDLFKILAEVKYDNNKLSEEEITNELLIELIEKESYTYNNIMFNITIVGKIVLSNKIPKISLPEPFITSQQNLLIDNKRDVNAINNDD